MNISFNASNKIIGFFLATSIPCKPIVYTVPKYVKEKKFVESEITFKSEELTIQGALIMPKKIKKGTPDYYFCSWVWTK